MALICIWAGWVNKLSGVERVCQLKQRRFMLIYVAIWNAPCIYRLSKCTPRPVTIRNK